MSRKYVQIGATGLLLAAAAAGIAGLESKNTPKILQGATINVETNENGSFDNLVRIDMVEICGVTGFFPHDDYFFRLSSLTDGEGKPLFSCEEKLALSDKKIDIDYIQELATLKNHLGKHFFTGKDVIAYHQAKGTVEYAEKFASTFNVKGEFIFRGNQMAQLYALEVTLEEMLEFKDTAKPNALLVYPSKDNEYGTFRRAEIATFHNQIKEAYDVRIKVAEQEQEVYDALDSAKKVELLVLLGHGVMDHLSLGENDLRYQSADKDETFTIDTSDWELGWHLQNLHPSATIFLYSCLTGSEREEGDNLANAVAEWADGRTVIAPTNILRTGDIQIGDLYPFKVTLFYSEKKELSKPVHERKREDITYTKRN